eukprot:jgi/Ulvmu1/7934/UM004_0167.1
MRIAACACSSCAQPSRALPAAAPPACPWFRCRDTVGGMQTPSRGLQPQSYRGLQTLLHLSRAAMRAAMRALALPLLLAAWRAICTDGAMGGAEQGGAPPTGNGGTNASTSSGSATHQGLTGRPSSPPPPRRPHPSSLTFLAARVPGRQAQLRPGVPQWHASLFPAPWRVLAEASGLPTPAPPGPESPAMAGAVAGCRRVAQGSTTGARLHCGRASLRPHHCTPVEAEAPVERGCTAPYCLSSPELHRLPLPLACAASCRHSLLPAWEAEGRLRG